MANFERQSRNIHGTMQTMMATQSFAFGLWGPWYKSNPASEEWDLDALFTGLTRDGVFLIEDGKIKQSVRNFRFNESPLFMLNNIEAIGRAERVAGTEGGGDVVMPTVKARDFNFTSLSEAV